MKKVTAILVFALLLFAFIAVPVYAFDPPNQDVTANATDVILWHGDNTTLSPLYISSANISLDGLEDDITNAAEAGAQVIADALADMAADFVALALAVLITSLAFWTNRPSLSKAQHSHFLMLMAVPVDLVYGLAKAAGSAVASAGWVEGIIVAIVGTYCLIKVVLDLISERTKVK